MSEIDPKGTMQTVAVRRYADVTQPRVTASRVNASPIAGSAIDKDDTVYGTRKEAREATTRSTRFSSRLYMERNVRTNP